MTPVTLETMFLTFTPLIKEGFIFEMDSDIKTMTMPLYGITLFQKTNFTYDLVHSDDSVTKIPVFLIVTQDQETGFFCISKDIENFFDKKEY